MLLLTSGLNLADHDVVKRESPVADGTRRRIDVEIGHLVIEVKKDLRPGNILPAAETQLAGYLEQRENEQGGRVAGVLTDGTSWYLYRLTQQHQVERVADLSLSETDPDGERLVVWLESIMATRTQIKPTLSTIVELLGADSSAHRFDHAVLAGLLDSADADPEVQLKRELWSKLLKTAYGEAFSDDASLFVNHTLLVITAEAIAHAIIGFDVATGVPVDALVSGSFFSSRGIHGVVEQDFFDWPVDLPGGRELVADVARRVARFDWTAVEHDVLKVLYESVIEQRDRQDLGEYYTPDWLAEAIVADRVTDPLQQRVLDPACGSGTFVFHAVKAHLAAADQSGMSAGAAAMSAAEHVFGIDIHPVAVTLARVTYLMAIGTARLNAADRGAIRIPVFLGDSLQWERRRDLFSDSDALAISTSSEDFIEGGGGSLFSDDLVFPATVWADGTRFDAVVTDMAAAVIKAADKVTKKGTHNLAALAPILNRHGIADADREVLLTTFEAWIGLQRTRRDRIWGYYVRNVARPVWLARPHNHVDVLIGNPPWLRYSKMTPAMQTRYKQLAKPRNLLTGGLGASARDLSTLFVVRAIELYLKDDGQFGFVMPFGTLSRKPHTGFRTGNWASQDSGSLRVAFDQPWDLSDIRNIFPMTSSVILGHLTRDKAQPIPPTCVTWSPPTDGSPAQPKQQREIAAIEAGTLPASDYERKFRQGAILVPRMALFVQRAPAGPLGAGAGRTEVESARTTQEKPPWKHLPSLHGIVEDRFLVGVHLGETVAPFKDLGARLAVLPIDAATGILNETEIPQHGGLADWWAAVEDTWEQGRVPNEKAPLLTRMDYLGQLSAQCPAQGHRVVYSKSGTTLAAARLANTDKSVIDHTLYWASFGSASEALYIVALLNSQALLAQVAKYQAIGLFGARHFDKYVFQVGIPNFDTGNALHLELADLAQEAENAAAAVPIAAGTRFIEARRQITEHLTAIGLQDRIEQSVASLLPPDPTT